MTEEQEARWGAELCSWLDHEYRKVSQELDEHGVLVFDYVSDTRMAEQDNAAAEYESAARWDHSRGLFVGAVELMPGLHKARAARAAAKALQLEADTGEAHCACHLRPMHVMQALARGGR